MQSNKARVMATSVRKLLRHQARQRVAALTDKLHPADVSGILTDLGDRDQVALFKILVAHDPERAADVLSELDTKIACLLLSNLKIEDASRTLQELESDDAALLISSLPEHFAVELLERMGFEESAAVQDLLTYEEETAGRIMTPNVFSLPEDLSVGEAIQTIQTTKELEMVFYLFVVDDRNHLVGVVSLRQLLVVSPDTRLREVMTTDVISVTTDTDQEEVARQVALYDLLAVPVVDNENKLVGVVTVDDVIDVIKDEATEDIFYMAGVEADDHIHSSPWSSFRRRFPWLTVNLMTGLLAAVIIDRFQGTIDALPFLATFLPIAAGMGGNSGTQTLTVIVRGLAMGEVTWQSGRKGLRKELIVGIVNGLGIGLFGALAAYAWEGDYLLGVVLGTALIGNMIVASIAGTLVPLFLKKLSLDPAVGSGIVVTTFTDAFGFFSFLGLAALLIQAVYVA